VLILCLQNIYSKMPSMSVSHGGILYYVVKVPRSELDAVSPESERGGAGSASGMRNMTEKVKRFVFPNVHIEPVIVDVVLQMALLLLCYSRNHNRRLSHVESRNHDKSEPISYSSNEVFNFLPILIVTS